jgi:hypothetical protein
MPCLTPRLSHTSKQFWTTYILIANAGKAESSSFPIYTAMPRMTDSLMTIKSRIVNTNTVDCSRQQAKRDLY